MPGHWEGDLLLGTSASCIATLVERQSRFVMLVKIPGRRTSELVTAALAAKIQDLPAALFKSLTWDQGKEMSQHAKFTIDTGVQVYFCDPRSPWQRGSNENTNGLLRQYFPKGKSMAGHSQARPGCRRRPAQRPTSTNPGLEDTITSTRAGVALTG